MKVVIVGGVAGGATAAARIRRLDERAQILVFERSGYMSYANCGLPYFIGGEIEDAGELTLQTPESFYRRFNVEVKVRHEVTEIQPKEKTVTVRNLETGEEFEESYDKLLLAPGAKPIVPKIPGIDAKRLFTLRTVEDTFAIKQFITQNPVRSAVVVGGGFIGLEMAENLRALGMDVTIVQLLDQLMTPFDPEMAALIHTQLRSHGVKLKLGTAVQGFKETQDGIDVLTDRAGTLHADMTVMAIGVAPENALAAQAGLQLGVRGSIAVDERMQTSEPDIYAVGDAVEVKNGVTGEETMISLAGPANKQGRIAADNICGRDSRYRASYGSSILKLFDMTAACTGVSETTARRAGIDADKVILSPMSHAGYYPGGRVMTMKVVFEKKTYRLLGAQIIGYDGVDKRIDVIAAAIYAGIDVVSLKELDLAYAPPYASAKDPVNMAGFMIDNIKNGDLRQWFVDEADALPRDGSVTLLDTRTPGEYARGHVEGFKNIPVDDLRARIHEIEPGKPVYVICQSGLRSYIASRILAGHGFESYNFAGGFRFYDAVMNDRRMSAEAAACGMDK